MVAAAGGAPAVSTRTPRGAPGASSSGALAMPISTVGAAQSMVIASLRRSAAKIASGSTRRRQTCVPPTAVTIQTKVQPLAWNIGSVQR